MKNKYIYIYLSLSQKHIKSHATCQNYVCIPASLFLGAPVAPPPCCSFFLLLLLLPESKERDVFLFLTGRSLVRLLESSYQRAAIREQLLQSSYYRAAIREQLSESSFQILKGVKSYMKWERKQQNKPLKNHCSNM